MRFDDRFIDDLKARVRLSDTIGKTVKLKRQGREFVGLSPFTKERSPSFFVNDDKGFYHDFSSGKHGDLISFFQETERLSFVEAVERLASEAGVQIPVASEQAAESERKRQGLTDWLNLAVEWFQGELRRPAGAEAREYLNRRGLPKEDWERFQLGFAPSGRTSLKDYLVAKGAKPAELVEAGLLVSPEDGSAPYDRFRNRIMFPIHDARGRVVSFGGRALDPGARAKYLNGPETPLFSKGRLLYGLPEARKLIQAGGQGAPVVVVEGYMDAIACQRAGIAAVAPLGTALTEEQVELLWRFHTEPTLCFDGDAAGQRAISRTIDRVLPLLRPGKTLNFATVVGGKDPDDVLREQGAGALRQQLTTTTPFADALFNRELQSEGRATPEGIASIKGRLRAAASLISDPDLSEQYRRHLFEKFDAVFPFRSRQFGQYAASPQHTIEKNAGGILKSRMKRFHAAVAFGAMLSPSYLFNVMDEFSKWGFGDDRLELLKEPFLECLLDFDANPEILPRLIHKHDAHRVMSQAMKIAQEVPSPPFFDDRIKPQDREILWGHCYEAIAQYAAVDQELQDKRHSALFDAEGLDEGRAYLARRRHLTDIKSLLGKRMSDVDWFASVELVRQ